MVDALRRARGLLAPGGRIVDLHPTPEIASLGIRTAGGEMIRIGGRIDTGDPSHPVARHRAADAALARCAAEGILSIDASAECTFYTYADTVDELRGHIEARWDPPRFEAATLERARVVLAEQPGATAYAAERLRVTRLSDPRPGSRAAGTDAPLCPV